MTDAIHLVTGGTGLLGSHVCERLVALGMRVRAIVRPGGQRTYLRALGVDLFEGDLTDSSACKAALSDVGVVFHAAAKVGDWGPWSDFERDTLRATAVLGRASAEHSVQRFVQISSTSAYGHPREGGPPVSENAPLGLRLWWPWDNYTRSKVECERLLWDLAAHAGLRLTIIRPSWLFGERDRTTTARIVKRLLKHGIPMIGNGKNPLSAIYAGCVAQAAILAAHDERAVGEAFNITDQGPITQAEFFSLWARAVGAQAPRRHLPYRLVFHSSLAVEAAARLMRRPTPPVITRYATWLMGRNLAYSTAKAREVLGWRPSISYAESIERTVRWYQAQPEFHPPR